MNWYGESVGALQSWCFERLLQPLLYATGQMHYAEQLYEATEWLILGGLELVLLCLVLRLLESAQPVEPWANRRGIGADISYTLLSRLGLLPVVSFLIFTPLFDQFEGWLRLAGFMRLDPERFAQVLADHPLSAFVLYTVVIDLAEYWRHRLQHRLDWWWALHALHHSQRKMSFWTDSRNHWLDDALAAVWSGLIAVLIGMPPHQFFVLVIATRMIESLAHANLRCAFGRFGDRLLVSPRFHRRHHAIGLGHEGAHRGCNFAVLLPIWDMLFSSADFRPQFDAATGIRDQLTGRDYGATVWSQQWLGLVRLWQALSRRKRRVASEAV